MAKAIALIASALCVVALTGFAHCNEEVFNVEGKVYCDTCRVLFETKISEPLDGAEVELECKNRESGVVTYNVTGKTDKDGTYTLEVTGDHEDEICDVIAVSSPDPDCDEDPMEINSARVALDENSGIESTTRFANPIGFRKKEALPDCAHVLDDLGFVPIDEDKVETHEQAP